MTDYKRTLITSALPYANGPVHIGHLAGVYVPADIYARYLRLKGEEVAFIGGSDEHGVPITLKAKKEGVTPQDVVDKYHGMIKDSFQRFGISFDVYSRTSAKVHHETAAEFLKSYTTTVSLLKKQPNNITTRRLPNFWPTAILPGLVRSVATKKLMATNAKPAAHH